MVVTVAHPRYGALREVGCPIKIDRIEPRYEAGAACGADTDAILTAWLGMNDDEIRALRAEGAI